VVSNKGARALVGMDTTTKNLFVAYRGSENIQNWIDNVSSSGFFFTLTSASGSAIHVTSELETLLLCISRSQFLVLPCRLASR
jgi:hypothetical protein